MQQITLNKPKTTIVHADDMDYIYDPYNNLKVRFLKPIGTIDNCGGKGFLMKCEFNGNKVCHIAKQSFVQHNSHLFDFDIDAIKGYIKDNISSGSFKFFVFEDERELLQWLAAD